MSQEDKVETLTKELDLEHMILAGNYDLWVALYGEKQDGPLIDADGTMYATTEEEFAMMMELFEEEGAFS